MKYIYILSVVLLFSNTTYSQSNPQAIKYRAFKSRLYNANLPDSTSWVETNILIVFGFNDTHLNKINVYAQKSIQYDVVGFIKDYKDESKTLWSVYKGVNDGGEEFTIEWGLFDNTQNQHISTLIITNKSGFSFVYNLKINE